MVMDWAFDEVESSSSSSSLEQPPAAAHQMAATTIFGEKIAVKAQVHTLGGFSAHAGQTDLLTWFSAMAASKPRVVLTHGEDEPREALAARIRERFKLKAALPRMKEVIEV
jgi:metallo-beta-lactamase family protein